MEHTSFQAEMPTIHSNRLPYVEVEIPYMGTACKIVGLLATPFKWAYKSYTNYMGTATNPPPAAPGHFVVGSLPELMTYKWSLYDFLTSYSAAYGASGLCLLKVGTKTFYIVSDAEFAKQIFQNGAAFPRGNSLDIWRKFSSDGLSEGAKALEFRGQALNSIGQNHFHYFFNAIKNSSAKWVERLHERAVENPKLDLMHECKRVTLAAFGESLFKRNPHDKDEPNPFDLHVDNDEFCSRFINSFQSLFSLISARISSPLANIPVAGDWLYSTVHQDEETAFEDAKKTLKDILKPIYEGLLNNPDEIDPSSHFDELLTIFKVNPRNPNYSTILNESVGFIQAGFETASKALAWTFYTLSQYPDIQGKLRLQLQEAYKHSLPASFEDLKTKVPLLFQVIEECLRLFPPFPFLVRDVVDPQKFPHYDLEKDAMLLLSPLLVHRNKKYWGDDCEVFRPDRWTSEMLEHSWQAAHPEYLTFIMGVHRCPGSFFAKQEISMFIAHMLLSFELVRDDKSPPAQPKYCVTLESETPMLVTLKTTTTQH